MYDEVIDNALEILKKRGWDKGEIENIYGKVCLAGAFVVGKVESYNGHIATHTALNFIRENYPGLSAALSEAAKEIREFTIFAADDYDAAFVAFNDFPETSFDDVEKVLEKVRAKENLDV